jgi:ABC-2 type transport system permease protein
MAQLEVSSLPPWTSAQSRAQLAAVAWLRWRIFVHSFRYKGKKRSVAKWIVIVIARILVWGIVAGFCVGPIAACGAVAYFAVANHHLSMLGTLTWTVFTVSLFISINISPATIGFDLTPLLRFPIDFRRYLLIRLFFGFFAIPTVVANLSLAAAAIGIGIARPELFPWAALVLGIFALHNVFFIRMIFAWVDRWMATRRAREIFGAIVLFASLGFQLAVSGGRGHRGETIAALARLLAPLHPLVQYLPPGLAADSIVNYAHSTFAPAYASLLGLIAFALVALAILAMRLKKEFRGENLSEAGKRAPKPASTTRPTVSQPALPVESIAISTNSAQATGLRLPPTIAACLQKELIYLKRSGAQLYGLITPLFFVFILTRTNKTLGNSAMLFPYAVSYMMFGLLANLYNVLGADGPGFNLYLLAPIRLRDVLVAKNLVNTSVIAIEILLALIAVTFITGGLPPAAMLSATLLWACFAIFVNLTVGNLRSLLAPMRFELGKARRAPVAKGGAFISLGVLFATLGAGIPVLFACRHFGYMWLATPIFLVLDIAAIFAYLTVLGRVDTIAASHRDNLTEALCKAAA